MKICRFLLLTALAAFYAGVIRVRSMQAQAHSCMKTVGFERPKHGAVMSVPRRKWRGCSNTSHNAEPLC